MIINERTGVSLPFEFPTSWWQWAIWALLTVLTLFVVRVTISLDINSILKARQEKRIVRLQNACPHLLIDYLGDGRLRVTPCFASPPGTQLFVCSRCQVTSWNPERDYPGRSDYYAANIDAYLEAERLFKKLLKKSGYAN